MSKFSSLERFLRYVKIDTQSNPESGKHPSTEKQFDLAHVLEKELRDLGLETHLDDHCYLYSAIPANAEGLPSFGLIAHMDTEPVCSGKNVNPQIVHYGGGDIVLKNGLIIAETEFPALKKFVGEDIVVTDGTTLLGADDKAGVAEIMGAAEYLLSHPEIKHGRIGIAFTPDEEIGEGTEYFDIPKFGCEFAYTVDGGLGGELSYETFNAAAAKITFKGVNIHPGSAKGKMKNCCHMAAMFVGLIPENERPETTEGREGFYHIDSIGTTVDEGFIKLIIRDHDKAKFEARKNFILSLSKKVAAVYGEDCVRAEIADSYRNCGEIILKHPKIIENAYEAIRMAGDEPQSHAIRGGTDGAELSYKGLPCPNLPTGGMNCHSFLECLPVSEMEKATQVLINLVTIWGK